MISASDLSWATEDYDDFTSEYGDPAFQFLLEQYSLDFVTVSDPEIGTIEVDYTVDAIVCNDVVVKAFNGIDQIKIDTLANEDSSDQDWAEQTLAATNLDEDVPPTLAVSGNNVRVFWYNGTSIMYHASADKGANWGGAQTALAVANVIYIAAVSTTKVHYATLTSKNNTRLGFIEDTGSWAATNSYIWWPFEPTSFDAVTWGQYDDGAAASNDIIAFTCDFPPLTRIRVDGDEIVRNLERVQGIALFRYQNGLWSHHRTYDMIDNVDSSLIPARQGLRLTTYDDNEPWIFMTYNRVSGTEDYPHKTLAISRSRTGLHWEMPYLIPAYTVGTCAPLVVNGDYCYLVDSTGRKAKSIVVGYLDSSNTTQYDLSANVLSIDVSSGDAKNVQVTIANPSGELDDTIEATKMWRMIVKLGWYVDDVETNIVTTTAFLDTVSQSKILPTDHYILSGRDALGRSISTRADEVQEWDHTQITGDNFAQMDDTAYSGMRNTAAFTGFWETAGGVLILKESENTGIAFNIKTSYVWNGGARCAVQVAATDTDDLGGVIFRALDHENFWYCVYDGDNDRLVLAERKDNTDTLYGTKSSMGWSISTWYYLDVEYSYNYISVYAGTSLAALTLQFQYEVDGVPDGTSFTFANIPLMEGSQGYYGHGFSEYSPSYPPPPTPPPIDLPESTLGKYVVVSTATDDGMFYTVDIDVTPPVWVAIGATPLSDPVVDWVFDPDNPTQIAALVAPAGYGVTNAGDVWVIDDFTDVDAGWVQVTDGAQTVTDVELVYGGTDSCTAEIVRAATGGQLLMHVRYDVGLYNDYGISVHGSFAACQTLGTRIVGIGGLGGDYDKQLGVNDTYAIASLAGTFYMCGKIGGSTSNYSNWFTSSNGGATWTYVHNGDNMGLDWGGTTMGMEATPDGDLVMFCWGHDNAPANEGEFLHVAGGNMLDIGARTIVDYWTLGSIPSGFSRNLLAVAESGSTDAVWGTDNDEIGEFGYLLLYKNGNYSTPYNTVTIQTRSSTIDSFRGDPDGTEALDRIVIGSTENQAGAHDRLVYLLTDSGGTLSNKQGNLQDLCGEDVYLSKVLFYQDG